MVRAVVEIKSLGKLIEMELKDAYEIEDCPEGAIIMIGDYTGRFGGLFDRTVKMESMSGDTALGFDLCDFDQYWEEIKTNE